MTAKEQIQKTLTALYANISFKAGEEPDYSQMKHIFLDEAIAFEYSSPDSKDYEVKPIDSHFKHMYEIFNNYPQIKKNGFSEVELENSFIINGPIALVSSRYKKHYYVDTKEVIAYGTNNITMMHVDGAYKIISIGWSEEA